MIEINKNNELLISFYNSFYSNQHKQKQNMHRKKYHNAINKHKEKNKFNEQVNKNKRFIRIASK